MTLIKQESHALGMKMVQENYLASKKINALIVK